MENINEDEPNIYPNTKSNKFYIYSSNEDSEQTSNEISYPRGQRRIYHPIKENEAKKRTSKFRYNISLNKKGEYQDNNMDSDNEDSEISDNQKIFTTITPNFKRDNDKENYNNVNEVNNNENKSNYNNKRKPQNTVVYKKLRTPDKKYTYYKKKKKRENADDNTESISYYTESNNQNNNSNIYDSLNEDNRNLKPEDYRKKINKLIKYGLKFELNNENNNYIDLLTMSDIKTLEDKINMEKLSKSKISQKNQITQPENNNVYIRKTYNKGPINLNINEKKESLVNNKSRNNMNNMAKTINGNLENKSYDCITFKKKIGINKKRKKKQNDKTNSSDKYYNDLKKAKRKSKRTPIKKENDIGGKITLRPKLFFNKKYIDAIILIQNWWRKNHVNFINKIIRLQRAIKNFLNKLSKRIIYQKKTTLKKIYKNKKDELGDEDIVKYIPKDICHIDKIRIRHKKEKQTDNEGKLPNNRLRNKNRKNINNIRTIKNQNINNKDNLAKSKIISVGKKQNNDKHKLSVSPLNKILISPDQVRYETERYTFMKRCYFRNREEDKEENKLNRLYTTEFMRKINLKIKGKWLTPDKINKNVNPLLQIDNLNEEGNIEFLSGKKNKYKQNNKNIENIENKGDNNTLKKLEKTTNDRINPYNEKKEPEERKNKDIIGNLDNLVHSVNITDEIITKCKMEEIIVYDNKNKNSSNLDESNIKNEETEKEETEKIEKVEENKKDNEENEYEKHIDKIILLQKNIKIFLDKLKPKIIKYKKTILAPEKKEEKVPEIQEKEEKDIYIKKKTFKKIQIFKNIHNIQKLIKNEKNNSETNEFSNINNEQNNINENNKNRDSSVGNLSMKDLKVDEDIENQNNNKTNNNINNEININEKKNLDMKYINKIPNKSYNINTTKLNNQEIHYINKPPCKAYNISSNLNKNLENNGFEYINKKTNKAFNMDQIKNDNKKNIQESINSGNNIEKIRNSCPIKEVKQINYKKYKRDFVENLLKNNVTNINQLKEMGKKNKYFIFDYMVKMFVQKVQKINKQFVFSVIKGEGFIKHKIVYFDVLKTYLNNKNLYINDNNDVSKLLKDTLESYSNIYDESQGKLIPYIKESDDEKLINTQLFRRDENCNNLISFISKYLKLEKNMTAFSEDLIKYHLMKQPIRNFNIFGITRYIENNVFKPLLYSKGSKVGLGDAKDKNLNLDYIYNNDEDIKENDEYYECNIELNNSENDIKNKKYMRKTLNYQNGNDISMTRHVMNLSSCDINNNSNDNLPNVNDSLAKKNVDK